MNCSEYLGSGKVLIHHLWRHHLPHQENLLDQIQRTGEKNGTKRHLKCDGNGIPLSICVTGANRHDSPVLWELLIRSIISEIPREIEQNLCLDKGYFWKPSLDLCKQYQYIPHIRSRWEETITRAQAIANGESPEPNRRWVVERTNGWLNRFKKLLIRFEKKTSSYEALLELACAIITYRQYI